MVTFWICCDERLQFALAQENYLKQKQRIMRFEPREFPTWLFCKMYDDLPDNNAKKQEMVYYQELIYIFLLFLPYLHKFTICGFFQCPLFIHCFI